MPTSIGRHLTVVLTGGCHQIRITAVSSMKIGADIYIDVEAIGTRINAAVVSVTRGDNPLGAFSPFGQNILSIEAGCECVAVAITVGNCGGGGFDVVFYINHWNLPLSKYLIVDKRTVFCAKSDFSTLTTT